MSDIGTPIPSFELNDGNFIPMIGYGTGTVWFKPGDESEINRSLVDTIKTAIKLGFTHLDGAEAYKTELELGMAIKESGVSRDRLFVTTKVFPNIGDIKAAIKSSLEKLQLDYVDLYLIHAPFFTKSDEVLQEKWKIMEEVQAAGLAKSIGVSNYLPHHIEVTLEKAKVIPAVNQIEFHPYLQHLGLLDLHKKHGIITQAFGPLTAVTRAKPGPVDELSAALADKYAVSEAEVALRWCIDQRIIPITTTLKEQRLLDYLRATKFQLTPMELTELSELGAKKHFRAYLNDVYGPDDRS